MPRLPYHIALTFNQSKQERPSVPPVSLAVGPPGNPLIRLPSSSHLGLPDNLRQCGAWWILCLRGLLTASSLAGAVGSFAHHAASDSASTFVQSKQVSYQVVYPKRQTALLVERLLPSPNRLPSDPRDSPPDSSRSRLSGELHYASLCSLPTISPACLAARPTDFHSTHSQCHS